jgi:hypothetical protein
MATMNYEKRASYEKGLNGVMYYYDPSKKTHHKRFKKPKKPAIQSARFLNVPYSEKDQAKKLGARWNPEKKKWYCYGSTNNFKRWL